MPHSRFDPPCGLGVSRTSELTAWLGRAQPGDRVIYHQGSLALDRGSTSLLQRRERRRIDDLATAAHAAAAAGRVHLVQERLATGTFRYLAVRAIQESGPPAPRGTGLVSELGKMRAHQ
jgi:hypothetical protein